MQDSVAVVVDALVLGGLNAHPTVAETTGPVTPVIPKSALSSAGFIWVEDSLGGTTPHIRYSDRPQVDVIVYSNLGVAEATRIARQAQMALSDAIGVPLPSGGIHRVITVIRPHREDISGLPPGVGRASALYDLVLSSTVKWS